MRVFHILSLLFSAAMCGLVPSWLPSSVHHQPDNESNLREQALQLLLRGSKEISPEKLKSWLSKIEVFDECANSTYSDPNDGLISSPNYPGNYSTDLSCTYLIDLRTSAESVLLTFLDFQTERGFDVVKVYDGPSVNDRVLLINSGITLPAPIQSSTSQMLVTFTSDMSNSDYRGFLATYSNGGPTTGCGQTYTDMIGNITSPNYPETYPDYQDCQYIIDLRSLGVSSVTLTFLDFQTERDYDIVYVYEGLTTSGVLLLEDSGIVNPRPVVSTTAQMLVRFITDYSGGSRGFYAKYEGN